jgi:integrase
MAGKLKALGLDKLAPGKYYDGGGLHLEVGETGSRSWILRTMVCGKRCEIGLGSLSITGLAKAREDAALLRSQARNGRDILRERRAEKEFQQQQTSIPTFEDAARIVHESLSETFDSETHAYNWLQSLETYVFPVFSKRTVDKITSADVLTVIGPIWNEKHDTAGRILRRIKTVFDYCTVKGYLTIDVNGVKVTMPNPCDSVRIALPKHNGAFKHHESLPYAELPAFIQKLRVSPSALSVKLGFEFLILTCARTGEVLGAKWEEFDLDAKVWNVPADRMKMKEPHKVPLSSRSIEILNLAKQFNDSAIVFPGRYEGHALSQMAFLMALRRMGHEDLTAHGFRATFKTWAEEKTKFDSLVIEASLAHAVKGIERHYLRTTFFDQRRKLMEQWAKFATSAPKANVVRMR